MGGRALIVPVMGRQIRISADGRDHVVGFATDGAVFLDGEPVLQPEPR